MLNSKSTAADTETAEAGKVLDTSIIKFGVGPAGVEQQLQDMDITASETTSDPVSSFGGGKGNITVSTLEIS
jgi:hypothetical protein